MKSNTLSLLFLPLLISFSLSHTAEAVNPAPDGGYPAANTAEGDDALFSLTLGLANTAIGHRALFNNSIGHFNTAIGSDALFSNTTGSSNTASGAFALFLNTTGLGNTASGLSALQGNITGDWNTATGYGALIVNTTGVGNTANGVGALQENTTGGENTADGAAALRSNTTGSDNVAFGFLAGQNATTGSGNVYIGTGMDGAAGEANHTYIRNIKDTTVSGGGTDTVTVDLSTGLLGHLTSSRRYKENIQPMDKASEVVFALKPVTYCYKKEIDPSQSPAFGLIAEEVAQVNPDLVACNSKGQPESVHYEMVNAMLLNEFLKEHRKVQKLETTVVKQQQDFQAVIAEQQREIKALTAGLKDQVSQIRRVSRQLELSKPVSQTIAKNQ